PAAIAADAGAAANPNAEAQFLNDKAFRALPEAAIPRTAMAAARQDNAAVVNTGPVNVYRALGHAMLADAVGPQDKNIANRFTTDQAKARRYERNIHEMKSYVDPAFNDWLKEKGYRVSLREYHGEEFAEQVFAVDKGIVPPDYYGPTVQRTAAK